MIYLGPSLGSLCELTSSARINSVSMFFRFSLSPLACLTPLPPPPFLDLASTPLLEPDFKTKTTPHLLICLTESLCCFSLNPFPLENFAKEFILKLVKWFSGHCQELKLTRTEKAVYKSYTSRPSDPDAKY